MYILQRAERGQDTGQSYLCHNIIIFVRYLQKFSPECFKENFMMEY